MLSFVVDVVKRINVGPEGTHIGVVTFGNTARLIFDFNKFNKTADYEMRICNEIKSISRPSSGERTFTNRGLRLANESVMRIEFGMRPDAKQVGTFYNPLCLSVSLYLSLSPVSLSPCIPPFSLCICILSYVLFFQSLLLITDRDQAQISDPNEPAGVQVSAAMKNRGIKIIVFGIGSVDFIELFRYASSPDDLLSADDFSVLRESKAVLFTREVLLGPGKLAIMRE